MYHVRRIAHAAIPVGIAGLVVEIQVARPVRQAVVAITEAMSHAKRGLN